MAAIVAAVASALVFMNPVASMIEARFGPSIWSRVGAALALFVLTYLLVKVVEGMANKAQVPGYTVAGKTGTAQIPTPYGYHPTDIIASFIGWVPADEPAFIILVKLDKPTSASWGSQTAAPTFRAIAERLLIYMQIPPDEIRLAQQ